MPFPSHFYFFSFLSETKSEQQTESGTVIESSRVVTSSTRVVTTRIVTTETSGSDGVTSRTETVTVQQSSSGNTEAVEGAEASAAAAPTEDTPAAEPAGKY